MTGTGGMYRETRSACKFFCAKVTVKTTVGKKKKTGG